MKKAIYKISYLVGLILSIFSIDIINRTGKLIKFAIYTGIVSVKFKSFGKSNLIQYPFYYWGLKNVIVGNNFSCFRRMRMETFTAYENFFYTPQLIIGDNVSINFDCHIACINKIYIGNNVLIGSKVFITDHSHGNTKTFDSSLPRVKLPLKSKGPVFIGDNVWIGEGVVIMPNVTIGTNCIIGANAVVTKSFTANSVIAGNPAKIINQ